MNLLKSNRLSIQNRSPFNQLEKEPHLLDLDEAHFYFDDKQKSQLEINLTDL